MSATPAPQATWKFSGHTYLPVRLRYGFDQPVDARGRPTATVRPLLVELELDAAEERASLVTYAFDSFQRASSYLEQRDPSGRVLHRLHIQAAYCVGYRGHFAPGDPDGSPSERLFLRLSPAAVTLDGVTVECHSVLPWPAPEEVRRRARMMGNDPAYLGLAAALPPPKQVPKVSAPALVPPPTLRNNGEKGVYGEHISDAYMRAQGHTKLNDGGVLTPPPPGGSARGHGIDGVWRHGTPPPDYVITEAKYDTSRLGMTNDGRQMSDSWIRGSERLKKAVGEDTSDEIRRAMRRGRVEKRLHKVSPSGQLTETVLL
ncbi:MAG TPA: type VI secretion system tube protein TssD [Hymenobacter sp.]|jgi:hypothetical protein